MSLSRLDTMPEIDHPNDDSFTSKNLVDEAVMDEINKVSQKKIDQVR